MNIQMSTHKNHKIFFFDFVFFHSNVKRLFRKTFLNKKKTKSFSFWIFFSLIFEKKNTSFIWKKKIQILLFLFFRIQIFDLFAETDVRQIKKIE